MGTALLPLAATAARAQQAPHPGQGDTAHFLVRLAGRDVGTQRTWHTPDGTRWTRYEVSDRGRGSALLSRVRPGPDGTPVTIEITGRDQLGNAVEERFVRDAQLATWASAIERGADSSRGARAGLYVPLAATPEDRALLARRLLAAPARRAALLPAGEAWVEQVLTRTFPAAASTADAPARATLVAIHGLGIVPRYLWLDERHALVAELGAAATVIRRDWAATASALAAVQDSVGTARASRLAGTLGRRPARALVLRNATVIDVERGRALPRHTVVVRGERIAAVGPDAQVAAPPGSETLDLGGRALLPGLWDMHAHVTDDEGPLFIAAGVTTVRDMGNRIAPLLERRRRFDDGTLLGPRVVIAGLVDGPGPYTAPGAVVVSTDAEARDAVAAYADAGARQIKIYSSVAPALVPTIVAAARERGLGVTGHVPAGMTAAQAVAQGFAELQHVNFLFLNFWGDSAGDTRTPARVLAVAERGATLDLDGPAVRELLDTLRARGVALDPTLNVFEHLLLARKGVPSPAFAAVSGRLPLLVRRGLLTGGAPVRDGMEERYRASFAAMARLVAQAHRAGIPVLVGSDAFAGFALLRELELQVQAGIPAADVLRMATIGAARHSGMDADLGAVTPGRLADLLVVDGDPLRSVSDVRRAWRVIKGGVVYRPAEIYRAVGVLP